MLKGKDTCIIELMKYGNQGAVGGFPDTPMLGLMLRSQGCKSFTLVRGWEEGGKRVELLTHAKVLQRVVQRVQGTGKAWDAKAVKEGVWCWWVRLEGWAQVRLCRTV